MTAEIYASSSSGVGSKSRRLSPPPSRFLPRHFNSCSIDFTCPPPRRAFLFDSNAAAVGASRSSPPPSMAEEIHASSSGLGSERRRLSPPSPIFLPQNCNICSILMGNPSPASSPPPLEAEIHASSSSGPGSKRRRVSPPSPLFLPPSCKSYSNHFTCPPPPPRRAFLFDTNAAAVGGASRASLSSSCTSAAESSSSRCLKPKPTSAEEKEVKKLSQRPEKRISSPCSYCGFNRVGFLSPSPPTKNDDEASVRPPDLVYKVYGQEGEMEIRVAAGSGWKLVEAVVP